MRGKFIVFEGGDGVGKTTQVNLLKEKLGRDDVVYVGDPGGTEIGAKIREIVKYDTSLRERAELFLFLAARAQLVEEIIVPALEEGEHVISNRFDLSTIAYQIYGRRRTDELDLIFTISDYARIVEPDLYIFFDAPIEISMTQAKGRYERPSRFEEEQIEFHTRVHEGYLKHLKDHNHEIIDATQSVGVVYGELEKIINKTLA